MIRLGTIVRAQPAIWLSPILLVLILAYTASSQAATSDPYPIALAAAGSVTIGFLAPVCAALGAWEAGRLRRAGIWKMPIVRSPVAVTALALGPTVLVGVLLATVSILAKEVQAGVLDIPDLRLLGLMVVVLTAHTLVGFTVGLRTPIVIAAPTVLLASFIWMAFPRSLEPVWLRHLTGSLECCQLNQSLSNEAVGGAAVLALGLAAAALLLLAPRLRARHLVASAMTIAACAFVAVGLVRGVGRDAAVARDPTELSCVSGPQMQVCVWPEHQQRLAEVASLATNAISRWSAAGIRTPTLLTEGTAPGSDAREFGFSLRASRFDVLTGLAAAIMPDRPSCADSGPYLGIDAFEPVLAWFLAVAGMPPNELAARFSESVVPGTPAPVAIIAALEAASAQSRAAWLSANLAALSECDREPQYLPA